MKTNQIKEKELIMQNSDSTVLAEYISTKEKFSEYESEAQLEASFVKQLLQQGYEKINIRDENDLILNLRKQIEKLNDVKFNDREWKIIYNNYICNERESIERKTEIIQKDYIYNFTFDNGKSKNIYLINKENIHKNTLQVIEQYEPTHYVRKNIYDVTILVNGLPLVHIELKRRGVELRQAFNQIKRYANESFNIPQSLFQYVQVFVISNGTLTKYYSNTTRSQVISENNKNNKRNSFTRQLRKSNSFEFTSFWADANNKNILDLVDFTNTFFAKNTILNILTKYCVFTSEKYLMVMRPYQIVATERIIEKIRAAYNMKQQGTRDAGGYIWHSTGSGKTLTSFKTATLIRDMNFIDKVLFVVDRKDLDYQTMVEYEKFEKGAANATTNTSILNDKLTSTGLNSKVIITTINKLSNLVKKYATHPIYNKNVVIIFDECHRSQFGDMHKNIIKKFKNYYIFGFTGTPILSRFAKMPRGGGIPLTTDEIFGTRLHAYTIVDAIKDNNVLSFKIDYINTIKAKEQIESQLVPDIKAEEALRAPARIEAIVQDILKNYKAKTRRNDNKYSFYAISNIEETINRGEKEVKLLKEFEGFNGMLATSSIDSAKAYYKEFKVQQSKLPESERLRIALIYSWNPNENKYDEPDLDYLSETDENNESTKNLDPSSKEFLSNAIKDYNKMFGTNYDISDDKFNNYYKDVSLRMKNKEIDLLIVVNMFLTGFDATTLNTLWVDKWLRNHGLIQAFSRTNRILNSVKQFGNIICYRNLKWFVDQAFAAYGDKDSTGLIIVKSFDDYYRNGASPKMPSYLSLVNRLQHEFPLDQYIYEDPAKKLFVKTFGQILYLLNILKVFTEEWTPDKQILTEREMQDYQSLYLEIKDEFETRQKSEAVSILDDVVFQIELVKANDVNVDYILGQVKDAHEKNITEKELIVQIERIVKSSLNLKNKEELIKRFIRTVNFDNDFDKLSILDLKEAFDKFVALDKEVAVNELIAKFNLKVKEAKKFILNAIENNELNNYGTKFTNILPALGLFDKRRETIKVQVSEAIQNLIDLYNEQ
ncbi:type I restriction endonuclease subunit R [Mycoplasmopsis fermentans]|uniref:type I restriction endonuclease subunit R n=1 Tax=Mycoplasmopsis fermentans TaxID=2115 RepID=UPI0001E32E83|nr:type I restriction endonuclease subunit R [Mycoplasmopsis fermentans]ADN69054.1 type I site-specific deoxyribonuclease [Mycoplasmopsis fermentans JER]